MRSKRRRYLPSALTAVSLVSAVSIGSGVAFADSASATVPQNTVPSTSEGTFLNPSWSVQQVKYLAGQQLADGAILFKPNEIEPYFANLAALGLAAINTADSRQVLLNWMRWYLKHLNDGASNDPNNLPGTIYDYSYNPQTGAETSLNTMDSVDSYAATTLSVANAAYQTGDPKLQSFVRTHISDYEGIAKILIEQAPSGVRLANGLEIALPTYPIPFTMDNAEVYRGLVDFSSLEGSLGRTDDQQTYSDAAAHTQQAMMANMWDKASNTWDWYSGAPSSPTQFYPGATAQLWPILEGVVSPSSDYAKDAWTTFVQAWPNWMHDHIGDSFPDTYMARAAEMMGDNADANTLLSTIYDKLSPNWNWPWFNDEAGWFLTAAKGLEPVGLTN